ncbi:plasmid pRiA4b ORF-3 family protein [Bradyrhizobium sp. ERR14]|uniref:plasmid pRiA4b ORF-3 family protein n=1 Tax=Bradyrhizobium sp. ERR14 TaxID=2663837 RepID=UPI00289F1E71|nr:plasmid pRiA4b ORF-3 family protein [Bradyrhizobium sp. ERR14]
MPDPDGEFGPQPIDAREARLSDIIHETGAKSIHYLYDLGDSWDHVIALEEWFDNTTIEGLPLLLEAAGRCPPEDVGGTPGYADYLDAIGDPTHPEHENMRLWGPRSRRRRPEDARGRRQRIIRNLVAAASRHAAQIDVKRQSKGPQSYAYFRSTKG